MKKVVRDFILLSILCFLYIAYSKSINVSTVEDLIISLGCAGVFSLLIAMIRALNEEDLNLKTNISTEELNKIKQSRLVARDVIVTFLLCYGAMKSSLAGPNFSLIKAIPFVIAAMAPALVVGAISREIRIPTSRQKEKLVESKFEFEKSA